MFDLRLKHKYLMYNLDWNTKCEEFVKALKHNTKCLNLPAAVNGVILYQVLKLDKLERVIDRYLWEII